MCTGKSGKYVMCGIDLEGVCKVFLKGSVIGRKGIHTNLIVRTSNNNNRIIILLINLNISINNNNIQ
jgi:hypothetical protein